MGLRKLDREQAQALTDRIKASFTEVGALLKIARDQQVWRVLGYSSFSDWLQFAVEMSRSRAYQLINIAGIEAELRLLGSFPEDFTVSTRTAQEVINFGTLAFLEMLATDITDDAAANENAFMTKMNQIRQTQASTAPGYSSNVAPLPVARDLNQQIFIALESLTAQVADFPVPGEVEDQHLESVRAKLQDAIQTLTVQRQTYAEAASSGVSVNA